MLTRLLRRHGLWPVVAGITLAGILASLLIVAAFRWFVDGQPIGWNSATLAVSVPLIVGSFASYHMSKLLLELDAAHEQLRQASVTDELTGASNRRLFMESLRAEVDRHGRGGPGFCVALIDIDDFKRVNDEHGHLAGDAALRALSRTCQQQMRSTDVFARFGGEEFAVLLPMTDAARAGAWLDRLRESIAAMVVVDGAETMGRRAIRGLTVSIGVAEAGDRERDTPSVAHIERLLRQADQALYRAKREGKNRVELPPPGAA